LEIDFELDLWGYYLLKIEMYERMLKKLGDPVLKIMCTQKIGWVYYRMGQYRQALIHYDEALAGARASERRWNEGVLLGELANCYGDLGQTAQAVDYYEGGLGILRETEDRASEGTLANNLGFYLSDLGQTSRAIECHRQALDIDWEIDNQSGVTIDLGNLGARFADLGQSAEAIDHCEQALAIAREIGYGYSESVNLTYLGDIHADQGAWHKAIELYTQATQIAVETANAQFAIAAFSGLALAHLYSGHLSEARTAIENARKYQVPRSNYIVVGLLGLIALRQGDRATAHGAFNEAITLADALLSGSPQQYKCLETQGLALCGLTLYTGSGDYISAAIDAYRAARTINADVGVVGRALRLLDALALAGPAGVLARVRRAAAGGVRPRIAERSSGDRTPGNHLRGR
jgi:tetratricopeptide (TPR) repeat protein